MSRVLIVDDEAPLRELVGEMLALEGYDCRTAGDAQAARHAVADWAPQIAVVDVAMPYEDGTSLAVWLAGAVPGIRVILYSAKPDMAEIKRLGAEFGAVAVIAKPFELRKLVDTVSAALAQS